MKPQTKALRNAIKHIPGAWVRVWRDGEVWAGRNHSTRQGMELVRDALEAAGFKTACIGERGTSGEFIVNVIN